LEARVDTRAVPPHADWRARRRVLALPPCASRKHVLAMCTLLSVFPPAGSWAAHGPGSLALVPWADLLQHDGAAGALTGDLWWLAVGR
jgi:hypothetical protein